MMGLFSRSVRHFHSQKPVGRLLLSYKPPKVQDSNVTSESKSQQRKYQVDHVNMSDVQVLNLLESGELSHHKLEVALQDTLRAVKLRRQFFARKISEFSLLNMEASAL